MRRWKTRKFEIMGNFHTNPCSDNVLRVTLCVDWKRLSAPCKQGGAFTPTAREGVRSQQSLSVAALCETGGRRGPHSPQACKRSAIVSFCISHELLDLSLSRSLSRSAIRKHASTPWPCRRICASSERQ